MSHDARRRQSKYLTGAVIPIDGGLALHQRLAELWDGRLGAFPGYFFADWA